MDQTIHEFAVALFAIPIAAAAAFTLTRHVFVPFSIPFSNPAEAAIQIPLRRFFANAVKS